MNQLTHRYRVAYDRDGRARWWAPWQCSCSFSGSRWATAEESAVMDKAIWDSATPRDVAALITMMQTNRDLPPDV